MNLARHSSLVNECHTGIQSFIDLSLALSNKWSGHRRFLLPLPPPPPPLVLVTAGPPLTDAASDLDKLVGVLLLLVVDVVMITFALKPPPSLVYMLPLTTVLDDDFGCSFFKILDNKSFNLKQTHFSEDQPKLQKYIPVVQEENGVQFERIDQEQVAVEDKILVRVDQNRIDGLVDLGHDLAVPAQLLVEALHAHTAANAADQIGNGCEELVPLRLDEVQAVSVLFTATTSNALALCGFLFAFLLAVRRCLGFNTISTVAVRCLLTTSVTLVRRVQKVAAQNQALLPDQIGLLDSRELLQIELILLG
jgi:hypothetical protein